jgi:hypothetical protein
VFTAIAKEIIRVVTAGLWVSSHCPINSPLSYGLRTLPPGQAMPLWRDVQAQAAEFLVPLGP